MPTYVFLIPLILITVGLNTIAQVLFKFGSGQSFLNFYLLGGLVAYGLSTIIYIAVLGKSNLSVAYPVVIGLTVVATTVAGALLLREKFLLVNWIGIGLILSGVFAVAFGKVT